MKLLVRVTIILAVAFFLTVPVLMMRARSNYPDQTPVAFFTYSPDIPGPQDTITFDASTSYDPDGSIVQYTWNFGDGNATTVTNPTITHAYPIDGYYTVELTVTDNSGSTGVASAVIQVSTEVFFRVCLYGTLVNMSDVEVTCYYNNGTAWVKAPPSKTGVEIKYDLLTQPKLAITNAQKYRNPGLTASVLWYNAGNIGFDLHQYCWTVFFKFQYGQNVVYWPNNTNTVCTYHDGYVETHHYDDYDKPYWDPGASTYVIRVGDIPHDCIVGKYNHPIIVGVSCPPQPQKYLTVRTDPTGITTIPGQGGYAQNTNVTLTAPAYVNVSTNTRYRFNYWDVDGTSQGSGTNPITVFMNANRTATAHYVTQYSIVFNQTGLSSDATGTVVTVNGNPETYTQLPFTLWADVGGSVTYSYGSIVSSSVSGKQFRLSSITGPSSPITVSGPVTIAGNYVTQYQVTFAQTGLDSSASGTVVTVNSNAKAYTQLPYALWVDVGGSVTYSYGSIVTSSTAGKQFRLNTVSGSSSPTIVTGPMTVTGNYIIQYLVTFAQTGLDSTASGTIVTVNGSPKIFSTLPYTSWVDVGGSVTYSYTSVVSSSVSGKQFRLSSITGSFSPITVTGPTTTTGNYVTQYQVKFAQTDLDSTATGTVVTANGNAKVFADLPYNFWVDSGSSVTYSYNSIVSSSTGGKQFRLGSTTGPSSPVTVSGATTVTGNYVVQYQVTLAQTGLDSSSTGTVVTVNSNAKVFADLPYSLWVDVGGSVTYSYASIVSSSTAGKQFRLNTVSGSSSPLTVSGPVTITGNYVVQYQVAFAHTGLDSTATGTVVVVNGNSKGFGDLPFTVCADSGSSITYSYSNVSSSTVGKRFILTGVGGPSSPLIVTGSATVTGNYKTQYKVTFDQSGVGADFTGTVVTVDSANYNLAGLPVQFWWDQGSSHGFAFASPLTVNSSIQYTWSSTSGLSSLQSGTLTVSMCGSVTGNYVIQNSVTFDTTGISSDFSGTVVIIDGNSYGVSALPATFYWQIGSPHSFSFQSPLVVTPNGKQYVWTSTTGLSSAQSDSITVTAFGGIVGNYKTQYYLTLAANPPSVASPSGAGWYDSGTSTAISTPAFVDIVLGSSRYRFNNWTTLDMTEIANSSATTTTVFMDKTKTVTATYITQYSITFGQTGVGSDFTGTIVTIGSTEYTYSTLTVSFWWDSGSTHSFSFSSPLVVNAGRQYSWTSTTGLSTLQSGSITAFSAGSVTGNYKTQYYLSVASAYGIPGGQGWYDSGAPAYATLNTGIVDHGNSTRHVFTSWNGDASGSDYAQSNPILVNGAKTAVALWKTQYNVTFTHSGLDSSASGTAVTVNSVAKTYGDLPYSLWIDDGGSATYSFGNVSSLTTGKQFILIGVSGPLSPIAVTSPLTITGNYKIQWLITFNQTGVGNDFAGTIVTSDGTGYNYGALPVPFWWDDGSSHTFSFSSPLTVDVSKQYNWASTTGLTTLQSGTLNIAGSGNVVGNYAVGNKYQVTFDQSGASADYLGTLVFIDEVSYHVSQLPVSFWWDVSSTHTFAYQSPLITTLNGKQYVWTSTTGLSSAQSGSITATTSGSIVGNYKTQYYLSLATDPPGVDTPSGAGWYDAGTSATISTDAFKDIVPGSSRYRFNGWTTANMTEITDPTRSPTTVSMDETKTVTANYVIQYSITFNQSDVGSDFTDPVVTIDTVDYYVTGLPVSFMWDKDSIHNIVWHTPLVITANNKQYVWTSTTGLSTLQSGSITVSSSGSVTGNYKTQYLLTVLTDPTGLSPQPTRNPAGDPGPANSWWYDASTTVTLTAQPATGYTFNYWDADGASKGSGVNPVTVSTNAPHTATAHYTSVPLSVSISPLSATIYVGQSVIFTSTVGGGLPPYSYQWYLDGSPVSGATSTSWTYTPTHASIHHVYLAVTDASHSTAQSQTAAITVLPNPPVGGYSISLVKQDPTSHITAYTAMIALFAAILSLTKRKRK